MCETQGSTAGCCSRCLHFMFCCYPRQHGSDDERQPLLNPSDTGELAIILRNSIFLRSLECKYNLLDYLRQEGCLTEEVAHELKEAYRTNRKLNNAVIDFINPSNVDIFKRGLDLSNQSHLVNFINKNGLREPPDDVEWPVTELDCDIIIKSYSELVEGLHTRSITDKLFTKGCLTSGQMAAIRGKENTMEQNRELLDIAMRRSVRHLKIFLECLQEDHAEIFLQSEDKELFAVNFEDIADHANTVDDIDEGKKEILRRAKERGFDARMIEDRLYFVATTKGDEGMTAESSGSDFQSESAPVGIKQFVNEVMGNDVEITQLVSFEKHPVFLRCLECQYDLLDHLQKNGCITDEDANELKQGHMTERERNNALIKLINPSNIDKFKQGLKLSNQSHLVNFINRSGKRESPEDEEWPASDSDLEPVKNWYPDLVRDLDNTRMTQYLVAKNCLSTEQMITIFSKDTTQARNRELLAIVMRRSIQQLKIFYFEDTLRSRAYNYTQFIGVVKTRLDKPFSYVYRISVI